MIPGFLVIKSLLFHAAQSGTYSSLRNQGVIIQTLQVCVPCTSNFRFDFWRLWIPNYSRLGKSPSVGAIPVRVLRYQALKGGMMANSSKNCVEQWLETVPHLQYNIPPISGCVPSATLGHSGTFKSLKDSHYSALTCESNVNIRMKLSSFASPALALAKCFPYFLVYLKMW